MELQTLLGPFLIRDLSHRVCNYINTTGAHQWSGNSLFLVEFVLLDLQFYVYVLQIVVCSFVACGTESKLSILLVVFNRQSFSCITLTTYHTCQCSGFLPEPPEYIHIPIIIQSDCKLLLYADASTILFSHKKWKLF